MNLKVTTMKKLFLLFLFCLLTGIGNNAKAQDLGDLLGGKNLEEILDGLSKDDETNIVSMIFALERLAEIESPVFDFSPNVNCLYILGKYAQTFENLVEKTNAATDCNERYGLLVMQEAMLLASTNIYYCVEPFLEMIANPNQHKEELEELVAEINYLTSILWVQHNFYHRILESGEQLEKFGFFDKLLIDMMYTVSKYFYANKTDTLLMSLKKLINEYFDAQLVVKKALLIAQHIEALPCDGG